MARSDDKSQSKKRPAEGDPDGAQPLTKRFGCLQIGMFFLHYPDSLNYGTES